MADYDWFTPTEKQLEEEHQHRVWLAENDVLEKHEYSGSGHKKIIVCDICSCVIYSVSKHRQVCFKAKISEGKHKNDKSKE